MSKLNLRMRAILALAALGLATLLHSQPVVAQEQALESPTASVVANDTPTLDSGDTAWILVSTALVLFMTIPALALFYGGIVVHVTAGFAALVACIMVGPRGGYPKHLEPPHNMTMTVTGTAMLWVGWFGFNAGSALAANGDAAMALFVTHLSASVATLVWMLVEWVKLGKPSVLGAATGSIAGLAAITPASGFVGPMGAIAIGACSALLCFLFATMIKQKIGYDDSLDVFGVHGVGGFLGTVLCGVFASSAFGGVKPSADYSIANAVTIQLSAAVLTAVYAIIASYVILKVIQLTIGLRVDGKAETRGLDLTEHEERGYIIY